MSAQSRPPASSPTVADSERPPLSPAKTWLLVMAGFGSLAVLAAMLYNFSVGPVGQPIIGRFSSNFVHLVEGLGSISAGAVAAAIVIRRTGRLGSILVWLSVAILLLAFLLKTGIVANNVLPAEPYSRPHAAPSLFPAP